jgi:hypothetical protein
VAEVLSRVEAGEPVAVVYARDVGEMPEALLVQLGTLRLLGDPSVVADMLGRALRGCYAAWG